MILAENLTKLFEDFVAVDRVNLDVSSGQILVLLGPNGAGKTTTVRMLTSILRPTQGRAVVAGYDVVGEANKVRASVGVLTEHHGLYGRMNSMAYLRFFGQLYDMDKAMYMQRIDELLERFGLGSDRKKKLGEYSKGMRQKLALVRALLHDPPVLLFDEPTSAMDPESARMVRDSILSLKSGDRTIVICTHNLAEAEELADQIAIIRRGKIIANDSIPNLKNKFLGPSKFEARFVNSSDEEFSDLPQGVDLLKREKNRMLFTVNDPEQTNPDLLRKMLDSRLEVVSFQEISQSLELAYLQAVNEFTEERINA
jgi:ABC-2 type transport system ATP-binding protein